MYEGVSVTPNIEKHAGAPLWPINAKHPMTVYSLKPRLSIFNVEPALRKLLQDNGAEFDANGVLTGGDGAHPLDLIKVKDIQCDCDKEHKILYEQIFGYIEDQEQDVMAYKTCKHTIFGAAKRQMKAAPTPAPEVAEDFYEYAKNIIDDEIGEDLRNFGYSYQQWYDHLDKKKQNDMDMVYQYLTYKELTPQQLRRCSQRHYEGICKVELQGPDGKPRMVCSIPLTTKFVMGPITWRLEEIMAEKFKGYCGGKNLDEMAHYINDYIKAGFTKVVEGDGSAFDNTQDVSLKAVDRYIYRQVAHAVHHIPDNIYGINFLPISQELTKTMDVIYTDPFTKKQQNMFSYTILGSVFSGDCDTTLCNTLRMALYNRYVNDKAGLVYGEDYICFAKGDDFTVMYKDYITDEQIDNIYYKYFLPANPDPDKPDTRVYGLGQVLKMLDKGGPEIIKFCSLRAWYIEPDEIILTRDPKKFYNLSKYSRKTKCMTKTQYIMYLLQQAEALDACYKGIDIFDEMALAYRIKANMIAMINGTTKEQLKQLKQKAIDKINEEVKKNYTIYGPIEDKTYNIVNNVQYRKAVQKQKNNLLIAGYWENEKLKIMIRNRKLTAQQLALVNQQINAEFSTEELRSVLGLDKSVYEKRK